MVIQMGLSKAKKEITRFEMAQMVAKAMANQDRANAEQQAMINRLADEFSNELNNLGRSRRSFRGPRWQCKGDW